MDKKPTPLPAIETDKLRAELEQMRRRASLMIEYHQINAKITKARFDAFVKEGFTPEQALELCK